MSNIQTMYGVLDSHNTHVDVATTERGAKCYATMHGYTTVTARYNGSYNPVTVCHKVNGKWVKS